jgi:hypothetical protein
LLSRVPGGAGKDAVAVDDEIDDSRAAARQASQPSSKERRSHSLSANRMGKTPAAKRAPAALLGAMHRQKGSESDVTWGSESDVTGG